MKAPALNVLLCGAVSAALLVPHYAPAGQYDLTVPVTLFIEADPGSTYGGSKTGRLKVKDVEQSLDVAVVNAAWDGSGYTGLLGSALQLNRRYQVILESYYWTGGGEPIQVAKLQPLSGKVVDQSIGFRIGQHPHDLPGHLLGCIQLSRACGIKQHLVGHTAPQEVRQTRRELVIV